MSDQAKKRIGKLSRQNRVRAVLHGTADRPRLSVHVSNTHVAAQLINDDEGKTLASATTVAKKTTGTKTEKAALIGEQIAQAAKTQKISAVVFDRGPKQYHGRVKALADAARKNGLEF